MRHNKYIVHESIADFNIHICGIYSPRTMHNARNIGPFLHKKYENPGLRGIRKKSVLQMQYALLVESITGD